MKYRRLRHDQRAFTLIEVLIIAPVMMVTIVIMMSFLFNQYGQLIQSSKQLNLQSDAQTFLFGLQDDLLFANEFSSDKNTNLSDPWAPGGGWSYNTNPQTLIISTPGLTADRRDPNRQPVYINTLGCTPNVDQETMEENTPLYTNVIYFVSSGKLYKRTVANLSSGTTCGTNFLHQTCPAAHVTATCPEDIPVVDDFDSWSVTYLKTDNTAATTPEQADRITVTLNLKATAFAQTVTASTTLTMKKLNE